MDINVITLQTVLMYSFKKIQHALPNINEIIDVINDELLNTHTCLITVTNTEVLINDVRIAVYINEEIATLLPMFIKAAYKHNGFDTSIFVNNVVTISL